MGFSFVLACIVAFVVCIEASGNTGLSYTDSLLGGLRRTNKVDTRTIAIGTGPIALRECRDSFDCRDDETCVLNHLAIGQCVRDVTVGGNLGGVYDQTGVLRTVGGVRGGQIYDGGLQGVGIGFPGQRCQVFDSQTCLATPRDFNPICKFTYDHTLGYCVKVNVCDTCAALEGPAYNLFQDEIVCNRLCSNTVRPTY